MKYQKRIRLYIQSKNLTFLEVAVLSSIDPGKFYRIMNCESALKMEDYEKICTALDVSSDYFFDSNVTGYETLKEGALT